MNKLKNINFICLLNIFFICVFLLIISAYSLCIPLTGDDAWHPFNAGSFLHYVRVPPFFLAKLYYKFLPDLLQMHPADFKTNYIVCLISGFLYILLVIFFSKVFYIFSKKSVSLKQYLFQKESLFLFPSCFLLISASVFRLDEPPVIFLNIINASLSLEYSAGYIFYFLFFTGVIFTMMNSRKLTAAEIFLYSISGFSASYWSEFVNLPALFSLLVLLPVILFKLAKRIIPLVNLIPFFSFAAGILLFYVFSGNFEPAYAGTLGPLDIPAALAENIKHFAQFNADIVSCIFLQNKIIWIYLITGALLLKISSKINKFDNNKINLILYISFAIVSGYIITSYITILAPMDIRPEPLYRANLLPLAGYHILLFSSLIITGALYHISGLWIKTAAAGVFIFVFISGLLQAAPYYKNNIIEYYNIRNNYYHQVEKPFLIFQLFNERAVMDLETFPFGVYTDITNKEKEHFFIQERIFSLIYFYYLYKRNWKGAILENKQYSEEQLQKRLQILEDLTGFKDEYNIFKQVKYTPLVKLNKLNFTIDKIEELEKKYQNNEVLKKAKASLYFEKGRYDEALDLYQKCIKINPKDLDSVYKTAQIYIIQGRYDFAADIYKQLLKNNPKNSDLIYEYASLLYEQGGIENYKKSLELFVSLLQSSDVKSENNGLYNNLCLNAAILYKEMKNKDKSREYIDKMNPGEDGCFYNENQINSFDEFYNSSKKFSFRTMDDIIEFPFAF